MRERFVGAALREPSQSNANYRDQLAPLSPRGVRNAYQLRNGPEQLPIGPTLSSPSFRFLHRVPRTIEIAPSYRINYKQPIFLSLKFLRDINATTYFSFFQNEDYFYCNCNCSAILVAMKSR